MDNILKDKIKSGIMWNFFGGSGLMVVSLVLSIIMSYYVLPEDYGLVAMTTAFTAVAASFVNFGFGMAIIRQDNPTQNELSSIFFVNIFMGVLLTSVLYLLAPSIADFYKKDELIDIVHILSFTLLLSSAMVVQSALINKSMNFKLDVKINAITTLVSGGIGLVLASLGYGVWSIVFISISGSIIRGVLLWTIQDWKPSFYFRFACLKKYFTFSMNLFFTGLVNTMFDRIYSVMIGKYFSATDVGLYGRAETYQNLPTKVITDVLKKVYFPAFSTMQNNLKLFKDNFSKLIRITAFVSMPLSLGLMASADTLIQLILPEQWWGLIIYLQLLSLAGVTTPLNRLSTNIPLVMGRSDLILYIDVFGKFIVVASIVIGMNWGVLGLIYGYIIFAYLDYIIKFFYFGKLINYSFVENISDVYKPLIAAALMGGIVYYFGMFIDGLLVKLILQIFLGVVTYLVISNILGIKELEEMWKMMREFKNKRKKVL